MQSHPDNIFIISLTVFILLLSVPFTAGAQDVNTVYYNSKWEITSVKYGRYYRNSGFDPVNIKFDSTVTDHYIDGTVEMTGNYTKGSKDGRFMFYYPDKSIKLISDYSNDDRTGVWTSYFENGQVGKVVEYGNGKERLVKYSGKDGREILKELTGRYTMKLYYNQGFGTFSEVPPDEPYEKFTVAGKLKNGYKHGKWTITRAIPVNTRVGEGEWHIVYKPSRLFQLNFDNGIFRSGWQYNQDNTKTEFYHDTLTHLITEPEKIQMTESILLEPGQMIRQNYVIKALLEKEKKAFKKVVLDNEQALVDFFDQNFSSYAQDCSDTVRLTIRLRYGDQGNVTLESVSPHIGSGFEKEAARVIGMIAKVKVHSDSVFVFSYRVRCVGELDYKK